MRIMELVVRIYQKMGGGRNMYAPHRFSYRQRKRDGRRIVVCKIRDIHRF
jgi:uncharacterized membrane-anchored protein